MEVFTMGFTKKSAQVFFDLIRENKIELLIDIRLNNSSQLAGFTKGMDLEFFLKELCNCAYSHEEFYAPTKDILRDYQKKVISWNEYVEKFSALLAKREIERSFSNKYLKYSRVLLLCSEPTPEKCHRRLVAEYLSDKLGVIVHHI